MQRRQLNGEVQKRKTAGRNAPEGRTDQPNVCEQRNQPERHPTQTFPVNVKAVNGEVGT